MDALKTYAYKNLQSERKVIYVKFLVSKHSKKLLKQELKNLGIHYYISAYGAIHFSSDTTSSEIEEFKKRLDYKGFHYLDEDNSRLLDKVIQLIFEVIHSYHKLPWLSFAEIKKASTSKGTDRKTFLKLFPEVLGMSIIHFIILQKIERIKELLLYEDLPISEISEMLRYKSEQLLTAQFKKFTGLTPAYFKQLKNERADNVRARSDNKFMHKETIQPNQIFQSVWIDSI